VETGGRAVLLGRRDLRGRSGRGPGHQPTPGDGGRVVRRFPARLHPARHDADNGPIPGRFRRAAVHAQCVPNEDVRQPFHHGHRNAPRDARRARQFHVRPEQRDDALHVRAVPLRRFVGAYLGKVQPPIRHIITCILLILVKVLGES